jgi:hypothetical protein
MVTDPVVIASIVGAIGVLVGTFLGAVTTAIGHVFKRRQWRQVIRKRVLFDLLEIWYRLKISRGLDSKQFVEAYIQSAKKEFPTFELNDEQRDFLTATVEQTLKPLWAAAQETSSPLPSESYRQSVITLSRVDPVLAYQLNGNEALKSLLKTLESHIDQVPAPSEVAADKRAQIHEMFACMKAATKNANAESAIKDVERDLRLLARGVGFVTYFRVLSKIRERRNGHKNAIDRAVHVAIQGVLKPAIQTDR